MDKTDSEPTGPQLQVGWNPYQRAHNWLQHATPHDDRLVAVCCQVLLKEGLSAPGIGPAEEREPAIQRIQACQHAQSGFFHDHPTEAGAEGLTATSASQLLATGFALLALQALGAKALHPLRFLDQLETPGAPATWLETLDWRRVVPASEQVMHTLLALIYRCEVEAQPSAARQYHQILDWLEAAQDPKTGLWARQPGVSLPQSVVAGFHLLPFFEYTLRPVTRVTRILDCALQLRTGTGSLFPADFQGFYTGLAAASLLASLSNRLPHHQEKIREVLAISAGDLLQRQAEGGVFLPLESGPDHLGARGTISILSEFPEEPSLQTWMHLAALTAAAHAGVKGLPDGWLPPRWPAFGWLRPPGLLDERDRAVLPLWLKKPACSDPSGISIPLPEAAKPAVSVVIPCYNLGAYLYQAIDSVFAQSFQDFEIILVDDGSSDAFTRLAVASLDCPRTRVVRQENLGLPAARNAGIRLAGGRYICCLDADDRLRPGYFAAAVPLLEAQPEVGFVTGYKELFDEREEVDRSSECALPALLVENHVIVPALFRREAWQKVGGFCETFSASGIEDWDFWISLVEAGYRAEVVPEVLYDYRFRADAMSVGMYVPQTWGRLYRELVARHAPTYRRYLGDVLAHQAARWAEIRQWALDQERAIGWWERQSGIWQYVAQDREDRLRQLQAQVEALEDEIAALQAQWHDSLSSQNGSTLPEADSPLVDDADSHTSPGQHGWLQRAWVWLGKKWGYLDTGADSEGEAHD